MSAIFHAYNRPWHNRICTAYILHALTCFDTYMRVHTHMSFDSLRRTLWRGIPGTHLLIGGECAPLFAAFGAAPDEGAHWPAYIWQSRLEYFASFVATAGNSSFGEFV
jgi:hypothetical protein